MGAAEGGRGGGVVVRTVVTLTLARTETRGRPVRALYPSFLPPPPLPSPFPRLTGGSGSTRDVNRAAMEG